jgi:hypothetical protein
MLSAVQHLPYQGAVRVDVSNRKCQHLKVGPPE